MKKIRPKKATAAKLRSWRVAILCNRAHYLGDVQAPDERTAEAVAVSAPLRRGFAFGGSLAGIVSQGLSTWKYWYAPVLRARMFRLGQPLQFSLLLSNPPMEILALKIGQRGCEQAAIPSNIAPMGLHPGGRIVDFHHLSPCEMGWKCPA
jgi:hypothetical protein